MAGELNTEFPSWLAAQYAPRPQSTWMLQALQQGMQREEMRQKLPLELQGMALQNEARKLAIEHQGIVNNLQNQELMDFAQDLPIYRQALETASKVPGGAVAVPTPAFKSKKALDLWQERQKADALTVYGQAIHQSTIDDYKAVTEAVQITGDKLLPGPNGQFDPDAKAALLNKARDMKRQETLSDAVMKARLTSDLVVNTDLIMQANKDYEAALQSGDAKSIADAKQRLALMQAENEKNNQIIRTSLDAQGRPVMEVIRGKTGVATPDQLTGPNQTKVQESQAQSLATIDISNRLEPLISSETVGARAFAESWIKDRVLAQAFPEMASETRAKAEQLAAQLRASAVKELRSDGNITEGERKQILQAVPTINDPVDSPARARELVRNVRKMAAIRALVAARRLGGAIPQPAAMVLDDETLADLWKQKVITTEEAKQAYQLKRE